MSNFTTTPNMNLILPNPAGAANPETGPQYALDQNQSFTIVDSHNHSPGSGVQITPAGMNISTNLNFQNNSPYNVYSVVFSVPGPTSSLTTLYTNAQSGGGITDLFYNDGAGNVIALTKAGLVNATIASLPGESYSGGTFTWKQGTGSTTPANFDIGSVTIRPNVAATTNGVVLGPPSSISSQYNVQLPIVPVATSIMQLDSSGNMIATLVPDNTTIVIASQILQVPNSGINTAQLANGSVTLPKMAAPNILISSSCGTFSSSTNAFVQITNFSLTITTSGKPVNISLQPDGSSTATPAYVSSTGANTTFLLLRDSGQIANYRFFAGASESIFPFLSFIDIPSAGSHTYQFGVIVDVSVTVNVNYMTMVVREL